MGGPTSGSATGSAALPRRRAVAAVRDLDPGSFAFVMATGIISTGAYLLGPSWLSRALLVVTAAGLVVLTAALLFRLALFWPRVAADIRAPERVFGFFTIAAGIDVLGVRLAASHPLVTAVLGGVACVVWLVLTYGVPASLLLRRGRDSVLDGVNGTWLLWVVGTQSLAVAAAELEPAWPSQSELLSSASIAPLSRFMLWVAVGSWVLVAAAFAARVVMAGSRQP